MVESLSRNSTLQTPVTFSVGPVGAVLLAALAGMRPIANSAIEGAVINLVL